ncbi:MAG: efflux RND transporter periplasmic adaptor subunit [Planctomycetaceae bacterium]|jgi:RND family efflux transporter MFP subunit|nr:efflux RND transporter periplasmic adaptor subunit [Planctomycetaceae bacterium]
MKFINKISRNNFGLNHLLFGNLFRHKSISDSTTESFLCGKLRIVFICLICSFLIYGISGCNFLGSGNQSKKKENKIPEAPEVIFDNVVQEDVQLYLDAEGWTSPYKSVDIRVRVPGFLKKYFYSHGEVVKQGSPLAQIEQEQYKYVHEIAKQDLVIAEQKLVQAKQNLDRDKPLIEKGIKTPEELLQRETDYNTAVATVERSKVAVQQAELNLGYTDIVAPLTGKTTQHLVDENNFVSPGTAEAKLLSITQIDPIYVDFHISDREFADLKNRMGYNKKFDELTLKEQNKTNAPADNSKTKEKKDKQENNEVNDFRGFNGGVFEASLTSPTAVIPNNFPLKGTIRGVIDNRISSTGQVTLRGELQNPLITINGNSDYLIYAGQICVVRIPYEVVTNAILIREEALLTDLDTKYVFVIEKGIYTPEPNLLAKDEQNLEPYETELAMRRDVKIGRLLDNQQRIILQGLKPGERYITKGLQRARHGSPVKPITIQEFDERRAKLEEIPTNIPEKKQDENKKKPDPKEPIQENMKVEQPANNNQQ